MFGGDIEGWAGNAIGLGQLGAEEECQEELGFAGTAERLLVLHQRQKTFDREIKDLPFTCDFRDITRRDTTA